MKRLRLVSTQICISLGLLLVFFPLYSSAVTITNPLQSNTFTELLNRIVDFLFYLALGVAPLMIIIAGFYFITAEGDPAKVERAKNIIKWTVIGLLVIFCSKGLIQFLSDNFLNGGGAVAP